MVIHNINKSYKLLAYAFNMALISEEFFINNKLKYSSNDKSWYSYDVNFKFPLASKALNVRHRNRIMKRARTFATSGYVTNIIINYDGYKVTVTFEYDKEFAHSVCIKNYCNNFNIALMCSHHKKLNFFINNYNHEFTRFSIRNYY